MSVPNLDQSAVLPVTTQTSHISSHGLTTAVKDDTLVAVDGSRR